MCNGSEECPHQHCWGLHREPRRPRGVSVSMRALPSHCKRPQFCGTAFISLCCLLYLCFSPNVEDLSGSAHSRLEKSCQRRCSHVEIIPDGITSRHLEANRERSGGGGSVPRSYGEGRLSSRPYLTLRCRSVPGRRAGGTESGGELLCPGKGESGRRERFPFVRSTGRRFRADPRRPPGTRDRQRQYQEAGAGGHCSGRRNRAGLRR